MSPRRVEQIRTSCGPGQSERSACQQLIQAKLLVLEGYLLGVRVLATMLRAMSPAAGTA